MMQSGVLPATVWMLVAMGALVAVLDGGLALKATRAGVPRRGGLEPGLSAGARRGGRRLLAVKGCRWRCRCC